ncbi:MAG: glycosyltransferase 87 family protein [Candidatus Dormibacteria bacterium]
MFGVAVLVLISAALHVLVLLHTGGASFDIRSFAIQAATVLHHQNVYAVTARYPYPPVWLFVAALCRLVASWGQFSFVDVVRIPACLGDMGTIVVLAYFGAARYQQRWKALSLPLCYALNPLPLLISAGHGQFDSLPILFMLMAVLLLEKHAGTAALLLGVAVALKGWPVLFAPYLVFRAPRSQWLASSALILAPAVVATGIYTVWVGWSGKVVAEVLGYQGVAGFGWMALASPGGGRNVAGVLLEVTIVAFVLFVSTRSALVMEPALVAAVVFMGFYAAGYDISVQYLLWVLPFLIVTDVGWSLIYSFVATAAAIVFYTVRFPAVLPWPRQLLYPYALTVYSLCIVLPSLVAVVYVFIQFRRARAGRSGLGIAQHLSLKTPV